MKRILYVLPFMFALLMMQSCEEDPVVQPLGPDIGFTAGGSDLTLAPGEAFTIQISATSGDGELNSLTITEDGGSIDVSRISINGGQPGSSAILLIGTQRTGFTFDITIIAHTDANTTKTYAFAVADANNLTDQISFNVTTEKVAATLAFVEEAPYFWMDAMVPGNQLFRVKLLGDAGSSQMNSFTVFQDDQAVSVDRLEINGSQPAENPIILTGTDRDTFNFDMFVRAHASGLGSYAFEIADEDGETMRVSIDISAGTLVDSIKTVLLLNAGGPAGQGGVNLVTGASVGSNSPDAHLIDKGIDLDLPMATNWIKKIGPGQNAELRIPGAGAPEGFSYETTTTKEVIQAAFDTGDVITETDVVSVDDLLLVKKDDIYFLVKVSSVNETMDNNADFYELEVKF
jgi:hypothetical protein